MNQVILLHTGSQDMVWEPALLSGPERKRAAGMRSSQRRLQYIAGRWALRQLCAARSGGDPALWSFAPEGKPVGCHAWGYLAPHLSLSHSGHWVLAASSASSCLGVDIEALGRPRPWADLARYHGFKAGSAQASERGFLRFWVEHEARYKANAKAAPMKRWRLEGPGFVAGLVSEIAAVPAIKVVHPGKRFGPASFIRSSS